METLFVFLNECKSRYVQAIYKCCLRLDYEKEKKQTKKKQNKKQNKTKARKK